MKFTWYLFQQYLYLGPSNFELMCMKFKQKGNHTLNFPQIKHQYIKIKIHIIKLTTIFKDSLITSNSTNGIKCNCPETTNIKNVFIVTMERTFFPMTHLFIDTDER